jgi:hypothetical protein
MRTAGGANCPETTSSASRSQPMPISGSVQGGDSARAGVGVGIAGSIVRQRLIFNKAGTPLTLTVGPLLDREHQSIRVAVRF